MKQALNCGLLFMVTRTTRKLVYILAASLLSAHHVVEQWELHQTNHITSFKSYAHITSHLQHPTVLSISFWSIYLCIYHHHSSTPFELHRDLLQIHALDSVLFSSHLKEKKFLFYFLPPQLHSWLLTLDSFFSLLYSTLLREGGFSEGRFKLEELAWLHEQLSTASSLLQPKGLDFYLFFFSKKHIFITDRHWLSVSKAIHMFMHAFFFNFLGKNGALWLIDLCTKTPKMELSLANWLSFLPSTFFFFRSLPN